MVRDFLFGRRTHRAAVVASVRGKIGIARIFARAEASVCIVLCAVLEDAKVDGNICCAERKAQCIQRLEWVKRIRFRVSSRCYDVVIGWGYS